jgi:hypothetical protein
MTTRQLPSNARVGLNLGLQQVGWGCDRDLRRISSRCLGLKVHLHEIFMVRFLFFLRHSLTNRYMIQYVYLTFSKIFFEFTEISKRFDHSLFLLKESSITERCS